MASKIPSRISVFFFSPWNEKTPVINSVLKMITGKILLHGRFFEKCSRGKIIFHGCNFSKWSRGLFTGNSIFLDLFTGRKNVSRATFYRNENQAEWSVDLFSLSCVCVCVCVCTCVCVSLSVLGLSMYKSYVTYNLSLVTYTLGTELVACNSVIIFRQISSPFKNLYTSGCAVV